MKKTLLIAAAALAAGIISTQASSVYSQNIVGYANVPTPSYGQNYCLSVPFVIGVSNGANEVFSTNLPDYTAVLIYDAAISDYDYYQTLHASPTGWIDQNYITIAPPVLPVGQGFFLVPGDDNVTNTFCGSIAIATGTTNTMTLPNYGQNYLVGSVVPYAGYATNGLADGKGVNLNGLPDYTAVEIYDAAISDYDYYQTLSTSPTGWIDQNYITTAPPIITIGMGFFLVPGDVNAQWKQSL